MTQKIYTEKIISKISVDYNITFQLVHDYVCFTGLIHNVLNKFMCPRIPVQITKKKLFIKRIY